MTTTRSVRSIIAHVGPTLSVSAVPLAGYICRYITRIVFNNNKIMNRDTKEPVSKIDDVNVTWQSILDESQDKLIVVDCHQDWCGPCDAVAPTLQRLFIDYDHASERLMLATVSYTSDMTASGGSPCGVSPLGDKIQAIIPAAAKLNLETQGCLPLFLCLRFKQCVAYTVGVDAPTLMQQIMLNIPDYKPKEED